MTTRLLQEFKACLPTYLSKSKLAKRVLEQHYQETVLSGPFQGLRYSSDLPCGRKPPQLLGTYERELHPLIPRIIDRGFEHIINVGAAEGYFLCGLGCQCPGAQLTAFEANSDMLVSLQQMIECNHLSDRVRVFGLCDLTALKNCLVGKKEVFLLMDVEGAELELLQPEEVPALAECTLLVETHDFVHPGLADELIERFRISHTVEIVHSEPRGLEDFPIDVSSLLRRFCGNALVRLMEEERPARQSWLFLTPLRSEQA